MSKNTILLLKALGAFGAIIAVWVFIWFWPDLASYLEPHP